MADNLVKFPRARKRRKQLTDVLVERLTSVEGHVGIGRVPFTCVECSNSAVFDFTNAIFKNIVFYCAGCGHGYRVTNPMFAEPTVKVRIITKRG
jgi:hypothetical protein